MNTSTQYRCLRITRLVIFALAVCGPAHADSGPTLLGKALVQSLQAGGYNIYFRHAQTNWSQSDQINQVGDWTSCNPARARQLSDAGRRTAKTVGDAIRALRVPVGKVFASPYCRTVETANLMNLGPVETTTTIMNLRVADYFGGRSAIVARARSRLAALPPPGTNTVLVAHGNVARGATNVSPGEGESLVFGSDGNGGFSLVGRLTPAQWTEWAETLSKQHLEGTSQN